MNEQAIIILTLLVMVGAVLVLVPADHRLIAILIVAGIAGAFGLLRR